MALQRRAKRGHACGRSSSCEHRWLIWSPSFQWGVPLLLSTFCREIIELTKITCSRNLELCAGANGVLGEWSAGSIANSTTCSERALLQLPVSLPPHQHLNVEWQKSGVVHYFA